jgi:folate-dependent phosphoribosylglycinamide formyltransferase PurN
MKQRIYLFCNLEYGHSYLKAFISFAEKNSDIEFYVVFSNKSIKNNSNYLIDNARSLLSEFLWRLKHKDICNSAIKIEMITNINSDDYMQSIPDGSIGFIAGFNQILQSKVINKFSLILNFHPSILPYYRGSIPSYWVIKYDEHKTGFTAHLVTEKIDAGEIIFQEFVEINPGITEFDLDTKISAVGSSYFTECLQMISLCRPLRRRCLSSPYINMVNYVASTRR